MDIDASSFCQLTEELKLLKLVSSRHQRSIKCDLQTSENRSPATYDPATGQIDSECLLSFN